jgi:hypothetical protein
VLQNPRVSAARSAAGRLPRKTNGSASAVIRGIPLIRAASAHSAFTNGRRLSAYRAAVGRRIRLGMQADPALNEAIAEVRSRYR